MAKALHRLFAAVFLTIAATLSIPLASPAGADPCPDVEVVFARGTSEAPGVGLVGQSFVDAVRSQSAQRTVDVYPVNYPASNDFTNNVAIVQSVVDGVNDVDTHIKATAANCPSTRIVLGGYSQGALVSGFVTDPNSPPGLPVPAPAPLPAGLAGHVAAVTLFGLPSASFMNQYNAPPVEIGPQYTAKTLQQCAPGDTICDGTPFGGSPTVAHALYPVNGMVNDAAAYAVGHL